ncbi:MAG: hypothetical protein ACR2OI_06445, partial [Acidimicrobiia bacterium]
MTDLGGLVRSTNPVTQGRSLLADDELDALLVLINERNDEKSIEQLTTRLQPMRPRRRGWLFAAAAALIVVLLAPIVLVVGDTGRDVGGTEPDVATTVPPTTTLEATTVPPTNALEATTPTEEVDGWTRVPQDEAVFGGERTQVMWGVTVGGPGLVAVGWDGPDAAVWISLDGIDWLRVPHDETVFGGASMFDVTVGGPGLVAVGIVDPVPVAGGAPGGYSGGDAAVWTSVDGITWSRVPHDDTVFGGFDFQSIRSVTAGGPGLVAVGAHGVGPGHNYSLVWTSVDGITWSRIPHDDAVFGASEMEAVTVGGPGLVAVGTAILNDDEDQTAAVWISVDGITWSAVPHDGAVFGGEFGGVTMNSVTVGGPGLVAAGDALSPNGTDAVVWTSVDGITWSRLPHDEAVFGQDRTMWSVTAGGPGLVAVGETHGPSLAAVWVSDDGITWSAVPHNEAVFGQA